MNTFTGMAGGSSTSAFGNISLSSLAAQPITSVTITTPNAAVNRWDFLVDTITITAACRGNARSGAEYCADFAQRSRVIGGAPAPVITEQTKRGRRID